MKGAEATRDGRWLGAAQISLSAIDVADSLALAMAARLGAAGRRGWRLQAAALAAMVVAAGLALRLLPLDTAAGLASLCVMAGVVAFGWVPHPALMVLMAPAAWMTMRRNAGTMDAFVAWGRTGLVAAGQGSATITLWSEFDGWGERRAIVLHKSAAGYIIIPKNCLTDVQAEAIRAALRNAGVPGFGAPDQRRGAGGEGAPGLAPPGPRRVRFRLMADDLVAARRFIVLRTALRPSTVWLAGALAVAAWWFGWVGGAGQPRLAVVWALLLGAAGALALRLALPLLATRWAADSRDRMRRDRGAECQIEWDAEGFRGVYGESEVCKAWIEVRRWYLAKRFVFLSLGANFGQTIPRRALDPAQLADLAACAAAAGVKGAGVKRRGEA